MKRIVPTICCLALLIALAAFALVLEASAQKGKPAPTPSGEPVTSTIDGLGVNTTPMLRVQSDQLGSYQTQISSSAIQLESVIQSLGDWELDMLNFNSSPQRKILVDLREPVTGSAPNGGTPVNPFGAAGYQVVRARFISKCSDYGLNFNTMQPGAPYYCPLAIRFDDAAGLQYRLVQNPSNFAETNLVEVNCLNTDSTGKCNQWKIEPSIIQPNGERKNVAQLLRLTTKKNSEVETDYGDFYLSFVINVTK